MHDGVEKIEQYAFDWCTSLEALFLPSSVTKIGYLAFRKCEKHRILSKDFVHELPDQSLCESR